MSGKNNAQQKAHKKHKAHKAHKETSLVQAGGQRRYNGGGKQCAVACLITGLVPVARVSLPIE